MLVAAHALAELISGGGEFLAVAVFECVECECGSVLGLFVAPAKARTLAFDLGLQSRSSAVSLSRRARSVLRSRSGLRVWIPAMLISILSAKSGASFVALQYASDLKVEISLVLPSTSYA